MMIVAIVWICALIVGGIAWAISGDFLGMILGCLAVSVISGILLLWLHYRDIQSHKRIMSWGQK